MHYKNGREAHVGDQVVGKTYNTGDKTIAGTLLSLTPGTDACSCVVGYLDLVEPDKAGTDPIQIKGTEQHFASGRQMATVFRYDYSECKNLLHADDVAQAPSNPVGGPAD